ncbi:MAG: hypothetical protein HQK72_00135 [Desulfamplus sp.]|nr:hypothetical protein [Desulfamplus sp.]
MCKVIYYICVFCVFVVLKYNICFSATIFSYDDNSLIVEGISDIKNDLKAKEFAIIDALLHAQEFLEGSRLSSESIIKEKLSTSGYSFNYMNKINKMIHSNFPLKYHVLYEGRREIDVYFVKLKISPEIYQQVSKIKAHISLQEYGVKKINCDTLSYQACQYISDYFAKELSEIINPSSSNELIISTQTDIFPKQKCNAENISGNIFIDDEYCKGDLIMKTKIMFKEYPKKPILLTLPASCICSDVNLSDVSILNGFPSLFDDNDALKCGELYYISTINLIENLFK